MNFLGFRAVPVLVLRCALMAAAIVAGSGASAGADPEPIALWPQGAAGSEGRMQEPENVDRENGKCNVTNVHHPSITPFLPNKDVATGTAIIIAPGGGHRVLCLGHEGDSLAEWFAEHGIAAFVLRYRLAREEGSTYTVDDHAMADTRRAIRMVRNRANEWNVNAERIGILGFSAGGELAALAAMDFDAGNPAAADPVERVSCRPDFQVLIYPGSSDRFQVKAGMPPAFIALARKIGRTFRWGWRSFICSTRKWRFPANFTSTPTPVMASDTAQTQPMPQVIGQCGYANGWSTANCSASEWALLNKLIP